MLEEINQWFPDAIINEVIPPYPYNPNGAIDFHWKGYHFLYKGNKIFDMLNVKGEDWWNAHKVLADHLMSQGVKQ